MNFALGFMQGVAFSEGEGGVIDFFVTGQDADGLFSGFGFGVVVARGSFPPVVLLPQVDFEDCWFFLFFEGGAHAN